MRIASVVARQVLDCKGTTYTYVGALLGLKPPTTVPAPSFNMINGGHYGDIFQTFNEFLVVPYRTDSIELNRPGESGDLLF
jgi:enolase